MPKHLFSCNETLCYKIILLVLLNVLHQWIMVLTDAYIQCIRARSFILGQQRQPCNSGYRLSRNIYKCLILWSVTLSQGPPTLERELLCDLYTGKLHDHPLWLTVGWRDFSIYISWLYSYGFVLVRTWNDYPLSLTVGWCDFSVDLPLFCTYAYVFKSLKMI